MFNLLLQNDVFSLNIQNHHICYLGIEEALLSFS